MNCERDDQDHCSFSSKITHLLRDVPPGDIAEAATAHEANILKAMSQIIDPADPLFRDVEAAVHFRDDDDGFTRAQQAYAKKQVRLPLKMGGCGMNSPVWACLPAGRAHLGRSSPRAAARSSERSWVIEGDLLVCPPIPHQSAPFDRP